MGYNANMGRVDVTHLHLGNALLAGYVGGKHENILSDKFSMIENLRLDMLSRHDPCLIALFRKKAQPAANSSSFCLFRDLNIGLMNNCVSNTNLRKSS